MYTDDAEPVGQYLSLVLVLSDTQTVCACLQTETVDLACLLAVVVSSTDVHHQHV